MFLYFILRLIYYYVLTYIFGAWCLFKQVFTTHIERRCPSSCEGKVAIVTGGASGIGYHVSKELVARGAHVVIAGRCKEEGKHAVETIIGDYPNAQVEFMHCDLSSLRSVRQFAEKFLSKDIGLHVLINNAGVMFTPNTVTEDGFGTQFQVNYLSHFYLTHLLLDRLRLTGTRDCWARIVQVSSAVHYIGSPDLGSLGKRLDGMCEYSSHKAYNDSKLLIVAAANHLAISLQTEGALVTVCSVHPGVVDSGLYRHVTRIHQYLLSLFVPLYLTSSQGADTILYAALSPMVEGQSGCYYDNSTLTSPASVSRDKEFQDKIVRESTQLLKNSGCDIHT